MRVPTALCLLVLAGIVLANVSVYREIFAPPVLTVNVLDINDGSSVLLNSPSGKTILIDAGPDASILRILGTTLPIWDRSIDAVILTNAVNSLGGGLPDVLSRYKVTTFVRSGTAGSRSQEATLSAATASGGVQTILAARGDRFSTGDGVFIDILWPPKNASPTQTKNGALALRVSFGTTSFILQSLPIQIERWLHEAHSNMGPGGLIISSTTRRGIYVSNGASIVYKAP